MAFERAPGPTRVTVHRPRGFVAPTSSRSTTKSSACNTPSRAALPAVRLLADDDHALAARVSDDASAAHRRHARPGRAAGGVMLPEFYNQLGAMHGTIMSSSASCRWRSAASATISCRCRSARPTWRSRKLNCASYWCYLARRARHARELLRPRRRARSRAGRRIRRSRSSPTGGQTLVARRHAVPHHLVAARLDQHHRHDRAAARARD